MRWSQWGGQVCRSLGTWVPEGLQGTAHSMWKACVEQGAGELPRGQGPVLRVTVGRPWPRPQVWTPPSSVRQGLGHTQATAPATPENTAVPAAHPDLPTDTDCPAWRRGLPGPAALRDSTSSTLQSGGTGGRWDQNTRYSQKDTLLSGTAGRNRRRSSHPWEVAQQFLIKLNIRSACSPRA